MNNHQGMAGGVVGVMHTWAPTTFGFGLGKTIKTACGKRIATEIIVNPGEATCLPCLAVVADAVRDAQEMVRVARELAGEPGIDQELDDVRGPQDTIAYGLGMRLRGEF